MKEGILKTLSKEIPDGGIGSSEVVRFENRPASMQIFSLQTEIDNLMTEYEMAVRNKEFARAQKIADEIDQIEQQKIEINSKMIGMKDGDEVKKEFPNPGLEALYKSGEKGRDAVEAMGYQEGGEAIDDDLQGLDDEDIESLFEMIAESGMQQEQGANIDEQLQSIM
jgi:hypothetical protein